LFNHLKLSWSNMEMLFGIVVLSLINKEINMKFHSVVLLAVASGIAASYLSGCSSPEEESSAPATTAPTTTASKTSSSSASKKMGAPVLGGPNEIQAEPGAPGTSKGMAAPQAP
jgi:hypothetical protein